MATHLTVYKIQETKLDKATQKSFKSILLAFSFPVALAIFFAIWLKTASSLLAILIFGGICLITYPARRKYMSLLRFEVTDKYISQTVDSSGTDGFIELSRSRNRSRGIKDEKTILFTEIEKISVKSNGNIVVTSVENNPLTSNGKITIPAEIEGYEELLKKLLQVKASIDNPAV